MDAPYVRDSCARLNGRRKIHPNCYVGVQLMFCCAANYSDNVNLLLWTENGRTAVIWALLCFHVFLNLLRLGYSLSAE